MAFYDYESKELENQFAVVTGGSSGIGLQIVRFLLNRGVQEVAILDKIVFQDSCRRLTAEFGKERVLLIGCDVKIPQDVEDAFKIIEEKFPKLDILVNCAGILDDSAWEKEIATNLCGTIRCTLQGMRLMSRAEGKSGGTIINTSSTNGINPAAGCPVYSAVSSAIISFTDSLSSSFHYDKSGIRMMNLCPGPTYTRIISGASRKMLSPDFGKEWLQELSATATQKPECVAFGVIQMLLHGKNGTTWVSEGGKNIYQLGATPTAFTGAKISGIADSRSL